MSAHAEKRRFRFEQPGHFEQNGTATRIGQPGCDIREQPGRALHSEYPVEVQTGIRHFSGQLVRAMEVCRGEVVEPFAQVPMLTVAEVSLDDGGEAGILEQVTNQAVERRSPAR